MCNCRGVRESLAGRLTFIKELLERRDKVTQISEYGFPGKRNCSAKVLGSRYLGRGVCMEQQGDHCAWSKKNKQEISKKGNKGPESIRPWGIVMILYLRLNEMGSHYRAQNKRQTTPTLHYKNYHLVYCIGMSFC